MVEVAKAARMDLRGGSSTMGTYTTVQLDLLHHRAQLVVSDLVLLHLQAAVREEGLLEITLLLTANWMLASKQRNKNTLKLNQR